MHVKTLQERLRTFAAERDWEQFHSPKNLSMALSVEASELLEIFQWLTEDQSRVVSTIQKEAIRMEIADIQIYLARIADVLDIDIASAVDGKIKLNEQKYPTDVVRGRSEKYHHYSSK